MNPTPVILEGDVATALRMVRSTAAGTDFEVAVLSERCPKVDLCFEYRLPNGEWQSDAAVTVSGRALLGSGSTLLGVPVGTLLLRWRHTENHLVTGAACEVRLRVLPSSRVYTWAGAAGVAGDLSSANPSLASGLKIFQTSLDGDWLGMDPSTSDFVVQSSAGVEIVRVTGLNGPRWAQQKRNGLYLVLDAKMTATQAARLFECDQNGTIYQSVDLSSIALAPSDTDTLGPRHFVFHEVTQNLLLSCSGINRVKELTWGPADAGNLLDNITVAAPWGVAYEPSDNTSWWVVGSAGVTRADRRANTVTTITQFTTTADGALALQTPMLVDVRADGTLGVLEARGVAQGFNATTHPALQRANSELSDYRNFLFAPILRMQP